MPLSPYKMEFSEPTAMKLAYVIATPEVHSPLMPGVRGVFADNLSYLKELGYQAVEVAMRDPADPEAGGVVADFEKVGLPAAMIGSAPSELQDGVMLCHPDESVRAAGAARLRSLIDMAARLGAQGVNIGRFRGTRIPGERWEESTRWMEDAMRAGGDYAAKKGGKNLSGALQPL